jgi:predicted metalloprotease with PDZ domain
MKFKLLAFSLLTALVSPAFANGITDTYSYKVDLTNVKDDKVKVILTPPKITTEEIIFRLPKMVPGTYKIYDFGRFVSEFSVGSPTAVNCPVTRLDDNSWKISNATQILTIEYWVEDTWDTEIKENKIFEPAGTEIDDAKCIVMNNHGFFGYIEGLTQKTFEVDVTRPANFYASTGLSFTSNKNVDHFTTISYDQLVDSPIMYTVPDTTFIQVGNCKVLVSVYNSTKSVISAKVAEWIGDILDAQQNFLGGKLPVNKYAFLIYVPTEISFGGGALEHNNSSMYFMPFYSEEYFQQIMKDVAAHEFFHIVTPLTLHSEEIHNFNFTDPQMSEHLWLYEGMTEYNAHLVQVRSGLISMEAYMDNIIEKMDYAETFNDTLPFTTMSKGCLGVYEDQYINVYQKGALINMCLDILIIKNSNGTKNLREVIAQLSDKYGATKAFKDEDLFNEIEKLTYPAVREFLDMYVAGPNKIPYNDILAIVGLELSLGGAKEVVDPGFDIQYMNYDQAQDKFYIMSDEYITDLGKTMKIKSGDLINKINGKELNLKNVMEVLGGFYETAKSGDKVEFEMLRKKGKKYKKVKIKGILGKTTMEFEKKLYSIENPSEEQIKLRKFWINQ